ncbi:MAG: hypothetical protein JXB50_08935 [Spirochaetes bacterium]|nr:hypothetical protein [Spirochaetota bacterium]
MKRFLIVITLFLVFPLCSWQYDTQKSTFFYTIDFPDSEEKWTLVQDNKKYDAFFQNHEKQAFIEIIVYDLSSAGTYIELFDYIVNRFNMNNGSNNEVVFCKYNAIRGEYFFYYMNNPFKIDFVVFKDNYYFYVVMGYSYKEQYNKYENELKNIINSLKIYYDNNVVYSNEETKAKDALPINKKADEKTFTTDEKYTYHIEWDKNKIDFEFLKADLLKSIKELSEIGEYEGKYWKGWAYYNIDFNKPDYEFTFWKNFYQDMYNKNYYRVNNVYDYFKSLSAESKMSSYQLANSVMKCIQIIPYERPKNVINANNGSKTLDFFTPNEVADWKQGDCDTKSLFMVIILRRLGYDAIMLHSSYYGHAMVGININASGSFIVYNNKKYYFIESTYPNWKIGDLPPQMGDVNKWNPIPIQ